MPKATILDVSVTPHRRVTGELYKIWPHGIIIDDARGVRYFAFHRNVIHCDEAKPEALTMADLFCLT